MFEYGPELCQIRIWPNFELDIYFFIQFLFVPAETTDLCYTFTKVLAWNTVLQGCSGAFRLRVGVRISQIGAFFMNPAVITDDAHSFTGAPRWVLRY